MGITESISDQLLLIDKEKHWTSFDVVNKLRSTFRIKKVGHAGTLDPLATGLLLIGMGKSTKKLNDLQGLDKEYQGIFEIGKTTPSFDLETAFDNENAIDHIGEKEIYEAAGKLTGHLEQIPPAYSAIRVNGQRAYKAARQKQEVKMSPRLVTVHEFEVINIAGGDVHFSIRCSKGTYIRSLAMDFGSILGVGAYLKELRRTKIGDYAIEDALTIDKQITQLKDAIN